MPGGRKKGQCYGGAKTTPRAQRHPTIRDLEWAAGFLEGEGHFGGEHRGVDRETVQAPQVNLVPVQRLQALFGGSIRTYRHPDHRNRTSQKLINMWSTTGGRARGIMMTLYALLSPYRRDQIRNALSRERATPSTVQIPTACWRGHAWTPENTYTWKGSRHCRICNAEEARVRHSTQYRFLKWAQDVGR